jgi:hypothetical protein
MIGQELSFYPTTYAEEQRMAERLSRQPGAFEHSLGNVALNDTTKLLVLPFTGGIFEPAPANTNPRETQISAGHEELQRELATSALSSMVVRQQPINEALAHQLRTQAY